MQKNFKEMKHSQKYERNFELGKVYFFFSKEIKFINCSISIKLSYFVEKEFS